jgi:arylsulfatase
MTWIALCIFGLAVVARPAGAQKKPNVIVIFGDDVGWGDLGAYGGGETRGAPTPNLDRMSAEGVRFTTWYGQASCTAGRASFITGRIPIRSALSVVVAPGDPNKLHKEVPTIAERMATRRICPASGTSATRQMPFPPSTASTR